MTPGGAGVSPAAPAAVPGVSGEQQRKVECRSRGRRSRSSSDGTDRRAKKRARRRSPSPGLLLLDVLLIVGGDAIALPQIRLRMTELTSLLPDLGVRMEVRLLVKVLLGLVIDRLVLGRLDHMPEMTDTGLELVVDPLCLRVRRMTIGLVPSSR